MYFIMNFYTYIINFLFPLFRFGSRTAVLNGARRRTQRKDLAAHHTTPTRRPAQGSQYHRKSLRNGSGSDKSEKDASMRTE
jgi:hypothetical protein